MFPHHEDEIAQSEAANECKFVNYWLHCEHLTVDNKKMSKSLGNFYTLRDLMAKGYTGAEVRWALMGTHYRSKLNFNLSLLDQARVNLRSFASLFSRLKGLDNGDAGKADAENLSAKALQDFGDALGDDLNIAEALSAVFKLQKAANTALAAKAWQLDAGKVVLETFRKFNTVLGSLDMDAEEESIPAEIMELAEKRQAARKAKDFAMADALRDELKSKGYVIEDTPAGMKVKKI